MSAVGFEPTIPMIERAKTVKFPEYECLFNGPIMDCPWYVYGLAMMVIYYLRSRDGVTLLILA
jgi:hypothetical protein